MGRAWQRWGSWGCRLPTSTVGSEGGAVDVMVVMEAIGEGLIVEPYLPTVGLGGQFVARGGSPDQKKRLLPEVAQGKRRMAFAHTEPGARYDLAQVGLRARRQGDGFVLDGDKRVVLHGAAADTLVVSARTGGQGTDPHGISLFLVDRGASGVTVKEYRTIDEQRAADVGLVRRRRRPRCAPRPRGRRAAADRGGRGLRHRAPVRGGGRAGSASPTTQRWSI